MKVMKIFESRSTIGFFGRRYDPSFDSYNNDLHSVTSRDVQLLYFFFSFLIESMWQTFSVFQLEKCLLQDLLLVSRNVIWYSSLWMLLR